MSQVFHEGEIALQQRFSDVQKVESIGSRMIRDFMLEQHQHFFAQQQQLFASYENELGQVWADVLFGEVGFISVLDEYTLQLSMKDLKQAGELFSNLKIGSRLGLLGIEFDTRRRNRLNVEVCKLDADFLQLKVLQSFGNCPKYIQKRLKVSSLQINSKQINITNLTPEVVNILSKADTAFIASRYKDDGKADKHSGFDVSHRGGKSGFMVVHDEKIWIPDFSGNNFFNSLGNLMLDPNMGLLIMNFEAQSYLQLTGKGRVETKKDSMPFAGYERAIEFEMNQGVIHEHGIPWHFSDAEYSSFIPSNIK